MPAARLSAMRRSSSWNMYGGIASSRVDGSEIPIGAEIYSSKAASAASSSAESSPAADRLGPAGQGHVELG